MGLSKSPESIPAQEVEEILEDPLTDQHRIRIYCKILRLTRDEGIEYMKKHGYKMGPDRYKQLLTQVNKLVNKRLLYEAQRGFIEQHLASTDLVEHSLKILNDRIRLLEKDESLRATYALERMIRLRNETTALLSSYKEKDQYVIERQAMTRKLIMQTGAPTSVEPGSIKMTKALAEELGIEDYDEEVATTTETSAP